MSAIDEKRVVIHTGKAEKLDLLGPGGVGKEVTVTVGQLKASVEDFAPALGAIVDQLKSKSSDKGLTEISISLGIDGKGKVGFLGTGVEVGGNASLSLKFKV